MGTHPIFESDFDCLTESEMAKGKKGRRERIMMTKNSIESKPKWPLKKQPRPLINLFPTRHQYQTSLQWNHRVKSPRKKLKRIRFLLILKMNWTIRNWLRNSKRPTLSQF